MMRKLIIMLAAIFITFSFAGPTFASDGSLQNVHSHAVINNDGTVDIQQTWLYDDSRVDGTEHFINMNVSYGEQAVSEGKEAITDYVIYHNGSKMEFEDNWNIKDSFVNKAGKYGLIEIGSNEVEMTFGITERTLNEFVIEYKVHNVVKETSDGYKYLHWTFLPTELSPHPEALTAEIETQDGVEFDKVYGFNYEGQVGFLHDQKNAVYAEMTGMYNSNTTLNIFTLLNDENNLISNTFKVKEDLDKKAQQILKGSKYDLDHFYSEHFEPIASSKTPWWKNPFRFINVGFIMPFFFLFFIISLIIRTGGMRYKSLTSNMNENSIKKLEKDKDFYYREEPDETANSIELIRDLMRPHHMDNNILSYYISKWTSEGIFEYIGSEEKKFLFVRNNIITFKVHDNKLNAGSELEKNLFYEFYKLADNNKVVTTDNLNNLSMTLIKKYIEKHNEEAYIKLTEMGYVVDANVNKKSIFKTFMPALTDKGEDLIFQHAGLKNYLEQFTLMNEKSSSEIELWDYYFYMAALYGITDEFKKELRNMPNLSEQSMEKYNRYYGNTGTSLLSNSVSNAVNNAYTSHNSSSSSSGGGGGSSGGGSGGGTR